MNILGIKKFAHLKPIPPFQHFSEFQPILKVNPTEVGVDQYIRGIDLV